MIDPTGHEVHFNPGEPEDSEPIFKCEDRDCTEKGFPCYLSVEDEEKGEVNGYFCPKHAHGHGFCCICGQFWGGIESFDFGPGYCEHCASEVEEPDYEEEYDEFDYMDLPEYEP